MSIESLQKQRDRQEAYLSHLRKKRHIADFHAKLIREGERHLAGIEAALADLGLTMEVHGVEPGEVGAILARAAGAAVRAS